MYRILITFSPILVIHEKPVFVPNIVFRQSVDAQIRQLRAAGAGKVFREVASGAAKTDRPQLRRLLAEIAAGDVVMVTRLDRLVSSCISERMTIAGVSRRRPAWSTRRGERPDCMR